jgi:hypothetical protein
MKVLIPILLAIALVSACGPSYRTTRADLDMTSYAKAPEAAAVVLERSGKAVLGYSQETNDSTMFKAFGKPKGGSGTMGMSASAGPTPSESQKKDSRDLIMESGVSSYTLEVVKRVKILTEEGLKHAQVSEIIPAGADLESLAGATFLPNGEKVELDASGVKPQNGTMSFQMPGAVVGAVIEYHYKFFSKDLSSFSGWTFQEHLPTVESSFSLKMKPGTSFPYQFIKTDEAQEANPQEEKALGMDQQENIILHWNLSDLAGIPEGQKRAALVIGD